MFVDGIEEMLTAMAFSSLVRSLLLFGNSSILSVLFWFTGIKYVLHNNIIVFIQVSRFDSIDDDAGGGGWCRGVPWIMIGVGLDCSGSDYSTYCPIFSENVSK